MCVVCLTADVGSLSKACQQLFASFRKAPLPVAESLQDIKTRSSLLPLTFRKLADRPAFATAWTHLERTTVWAKFAMAFCSLHTSSALLPKRSSLCQSRQRPMSRRHCLQVRSGSGAGATPPKSFKGKCYVVKHVRSCWSIFWECKGYICQMQYKQ